MYLLQYFLLLVVSKIIIVLAIWPPPYKIDLRQSEEFIIGDYFENHQDDFDPEDEMIKGVEIEKFQLEKEKHKFQLLHKQVKRFNDNVNENKYYLKENNDFNAEENESYYDSREFEPHNAGFIDKNNNFILNQENKHVYYFNKITKQLVASEIKEKREEKQKNDYSYDELNKEYNLEVEKELQLNETFNSTNIEENESVKDALNEMVDFNSTPRNCTAEEINGIGFSAVKCVWINMKTSETKESKLEVLNRIKRIILIWFLIYVSIAVPCWCHKGWCCCCCQCKFCKPREIIDEAKKYLVDSPPGIIVDKNGETINYEPTIYEINAYMKLERALMNL